MTSRFTACWPGRAAARTQGSGIACGRSAPGPAPGERCAEHAGACYRKAAPALGLARAQGRVCRWVQRELRALPRISPDPSSLGRSCLERDLPRPRKSAVIAPPGRADGLPPSAARPQGPTRHGAHRVEYPRHRSTDGNGPCTRTDPCSPTMNGNSSRMPLRRSPRLQARRYWRKSRMSSRRAWSF